MTPPSTEQPAPPGPAPQRVIRGMTFMLLSTLCFTGLSICVRILSEELHPLQVSFFRCLFGLMVLAPLFVRHGAAPLRTQRMGLHFLRTLCAVGSMFFFFTALSMVALAKVTAIHFTAPLFASVLAVAFLGERIRARRLIALVVGFGGAWIILRPGPLGIEVGTLVVLAASVIWAFGLMTTKVIARTESSLTIAAYLGLFSTPIALVPALFVWQSPSWEALGILVLVGVFGNGHHMAMAQAFKHADATAVLPLDFNRLIWTSLFGYLLFAEVPTLATLVGGTLIFGAGTYIAIRERQVERQRRRDEATEAARAQTAESHGERLPPAV